MSPTHQERISRSCHRQARISLGLLAAGLSVPNAFSTPSQAAAVSTELVQLESVHVMPTWFLVDYSLDAEGKIKVVAVMEVTPGSHAAKASVRKGDFLEAINTRPVQGMLPGEFDRLLYSQLAKGEAKTFRFRLNRGFFKQRSTLLDLKVVQR